MFSPYLWYCVKSSYFKVCAVHLPEPGGIYVSSLSSGKLVKERRGEEELLQNHWRLVKLEMG